MGALFFRMPKSASQPEHWTLISADMAGPAGAGVMKLRDYFTWYRHQSESPYTNQLKLRNRDGTGWIGLMHMGPAALYSINYDAAVANIGDIVYRDAASGWIMRENNIVGYDRGSHDDVGVTYTSGHAGVVDAYEISAAGWTGDEGGTQVKYNTSAVSIYALPVGMFMEDAAIYMAELAAPAHSPYKSAQLASVEVICHLRGWSVAKTGMPWFVRYKDMFNNGTYPGVGSLQFMGTENSDDLYTLLFSRSIYTITKAPELPYYRPSGGQMLWTGDLNHLGRPAVHGLEPQADLIVSQIFNKSTYEVTDVLNYAVQVSGVPLQEFPTPADGINGRTLHNYMNVSFEVKIVYAY
jgi:hypothetical protein